MLLENKVAIITGASSGIGKATAKLFAKEGAKLVLSARRGALLDDLVKTIQAENGIATALAGDIIDEAYAKALVDLAVREFGGLDIGFNNAGTLGDITPIPDMDTASWRTTLATNLDSAFFAAKYQIPAMLQRKAGSIIFTSSFIGHTGGLPGMGAYAASKAGLIGLTQILAVEHGADGIRANTLLPGGTKTPMAGDDPDYHQFVETLHALKRMADPTEIARAALFLASDQSSFVTGSALLADGGTSICKI